MSVPRVLRISVRAIGGFVPRFQECRLDVAALPAGEAEILAGLVFASGILAYPPGTVTRVPGAADVVTYTLTVETGPGDHAHTVTFDSLSVPEAARPLLRYLLARSHDILDHVDLGRSGSMTDEPAAAETIVIVNSGSTNRPGYEITVHESGTLVYRETPSGGGPDREAGGGSRTVPREVLTRIFGDVRAALPFSQYPDPGCPKSKSFGVVIRIRHGREQSPDLACPVHDPRLEALVKDVRDIERIAAPGPQSEGA